MKEWTEGEGGLMWKSRCAASRAAAAAPGWFRDDLGLRLESELAHADEVLRDLGQALLVLVHQELGPVHEVLIDLFQSLHVLLACT